MAIFFWISGSGMYSCFDEWSWSCLVSSPDPTLGEGKGLVTFERFLGSCKFSILTFAKANQIAALRFSYDLASAMIWSCSNMPAGDLAPANENAVLWFCIALRSNVGLARGWLHNIGMKSRACTTKKPFQCHQTLPCAGIWAGYETRWGEVALLWIIHSRLLMHIMHDLWLIPTCYSMLL